MFRISVRFRLGLEFGWFRVSGVIFFVLVSADPLPAVSAFPCSREGFRDLLSLVPAALSQAPTSTFGTMCGARDTENMRCLTREVTETDPGPGLPSSHDLVQ